MRITYSDCTSVALVMQHEMRMRLIILSRVACPNLQYFPHFPINDTILENKKKVIEDKMCVLIFFTTFFV